VPAYRSLGGGPPAPVVDVTFAWGGQARVVVGILDTGAGQTQIPEDVARFLQLRPTGSMKVMNADSSTSDELLYAADVEVEGFGFGTIEVVGSPLGIALVGRDILNQLVATFDGPGLSFTLERQP